MYKIVLLIFIVFLSLNSFAQNKLIVEKIDSITPDYRSNNYSLDSVDAIYGNDENLRAGGFNTPEFGLNKFLSQNNDLGAKLGGFNYLQRNIQTPFIFTPLPYIGFQYSFGSSTTQNLNLQYSQALSSNTFINLRYNKKSSAGFLRLGQYNVNDVNAVVVSKNKHYSTKFDLSYSSYKFDENGGVASDSLLQDYLLILIPVRKTQAETTVKRADIHWENYINFSNDSLIKTGVFQQTRFEILNRTYIENNPYLLFDTLFIDSNRTRDQFQTASIKNGGGYFFSSKYFEINASINHRFWRNQNLGSNFDTTEIFLASDLYAGFEKFNLSNEFYFNLIGASGEFKNFTRLNMNTKIFDFKAKLDFLNVFPTPYQRRNRGNNYAWKLNSLNPQQVIAIGGDIKLNGKLNTGASFDFTTINNPLLFIENKWRQDTLNTIASGNLDLWVAYKVGKFGFHHKVDINFNSENFNYQPKFIAKTRINFSSPIFKAQKLKVNIGVDGSYISDYNSMFYVPELSLYSLSSQGVSTGDYFLFNAFAGIEIDPFKLYIRAENISNLWNDARTRIDEASPIMPLYMKLGLTWDFFN